MVEKTLERGGTVGQPGNGSVVSELLRPWISVDGLSPEAYRNTFGADPRSVNLGRGGLRFTGGSRVLSSLR